MEQKLCTKCKTVKSLDSFSKNKTTKDGKQQSCKSCYKRYVEKIKKRLNTQEHSITQTIKNKFQKNTKNGTKERKQR